MMRYRVRLFEEELKLCSILSWPRTSCGLLADVFMLSTHLATSSYNDSNTARFMQLAAWRDALSTSLARR